MAKDSFKIISEDDYDADIEEQVRSYIRDTISLPVNNRLFERTIIPDFKSDEEAKEKWENEEIRKLFEGDGDGMCGKMYFWYNYVYMQGMSGIVRPDYKVCQAEWFNEVEEAIENKNGIICVKRRRVGNSWMEACDVLHDCITKPHFHVGMNSKTEDDSEHLFKKIVFIYERLPDFLRVKIGRRHGLNIEFFRKKKLEDGTIRKYGLQSAITVKSPVDTAFEGLLLNKWVCDEAGKIANLPQMWSFTEPCLMDDHRRSGIPILFGTSGDIATTGGGLMHMWDKAKLYNLKRFFFAGWMGISVDEYGNDRKEEVIRWILHQRKIKAQISPKEYNDFIQMYPLTVEEAFSQSGGGLGDVVKINAQKAVLRETPPIIKKGDVRLNLESGTPEFIPKHFGEVKIYEHPQPNADYVIGLDPADHDDATDEASDLSLHVIKLPKGTDPPKIVVEYVSRPQKLVEYYEQSALIASYYNNTRVLIERNRYRIIDYFKTNGYNHLLEYRPQAINSIVKRRANEVGIHMTEDIKKYMEGLICEYIDNYCEYIPSIDLLTECLEYKQRNTDRVMSFGIALIMMRNKISVKRPTKEKSYNPKIPNISFQMKNGRMVRVSNRDKRKDRVPEKLPFIY